MRSIAPKMQSLQRMLGEIDSVRLRAVALVPVAMEVM